MVLEQSLRGKAFKNIIISMVGERYPKVRVLDLASGGKCIIKDLVLEGVEYTAVEIRKENVNSLTSQLGHLPQVKIVQGDARKIDELNLGEFDVVIIAGLFYHLNPKDHLKVLNNSLALAEAGIIIDTVFANEKVTNNKYYELNGYVLEGNTYYEHRPKEKGQLVAARLRASYQYNGEHYLSYTMTEDSFVRLLRKLGCQMISRYKYAPVLSEAPVRPPKTGDASKPWTALMNSERGMLAVYLDPGLIGPRAESGYFHFSAGEGSLGDLSNEQLEQIKNHLFSLLKNNLKNKSDLFEIIHNAGRMLPLSLHNIIVEAGIRAKMELSDIVTLRVYAESYLRNVSPAKEKQAACFINSYFVYLRSFNESWSQSMAETFYKYLANFLTPTLIKTIVNWMNNEATISQKSHKLQNNLVNKMMGLIIQ